MLKRVITAAALCVALLSPGLSQAQREGDLWHVQPGDSLSRIARALAPDDPSARKPLMDALVTLNPHAFKDGNPDWLFAGVSLKIPTGSQIAAARSTPSAQQRRTAPVARAKPALAPEPEAVPAPDEAQGIELAAARVVYTRGSATAARQDGDVRSLEKDSDVFEGDTVNTGPGSYVRLRYDDGATMLLRPSTRLEVEEYRNTGDPDTEGALLNLVRGGFRTVTGAIGSTNRGSYSVRTPVATIGIRGTDYSVLWCETCAGVDSGLYLKVDDGATALDSGQGMLNVGAGQNSFVPRAGGAPRYIRVPPAALQLPNPGCE